VTFNSAEAADRACYDSPHKLNGHLVYAERYRGQGPAEDKPIPATDAAISSVTASPSQQSSTTVPATSSSTQRESTTSSSGTVLAQLASNPETRLNPSSSLNGNILVSSASTNMAQSSSSAIDQPSRQALRIRGAKRAVLLPADKAILPGSSRWQRTFGSWPVIGLFLGGPSHEFIGNEVPRKEDGSFDWDKASLYWKFWATLDYYISFADFLGLKGDD